MTERGTYVKQYFIADRERVSLTFNYSLAPVQRQSQLRGAWYVDGADHVSVWALRLFYQCVVPVYWRAITWMWRVGLVEPAEAESFSWRRDFRPFPWRGLRRERSHS